MATKNYLAGLMALPMYTGVIGASPTNTPGVFTLINAGENDKKIAYCVDTGEFIYRTMGNNDLDKSTIFNAYGVGAYVWSGTAWDVVPASHTRQHAITSTSDHTSEATPGQVLIADANGLPVDGTNTDAEISAAYDGRIQVAPDARHFYFETP